MPSIIFIFVLLALLCVSNIAQIAWTPIYVDEKSQIDLWTQQAKGCPCPWDTTGKQCACCADGGCLCGKETANRCTQCGLEQYCNHMCNVTVDAKELLTKSGKTFGLIKSPSLEGPSFCSYTFIPAPNQRVEIQIYRLLNIGKLNGTRCVNGYLQLIRGTEPIDNTTDYVLCATNERYSPPVVFFIDEGIATLLIEITEKTQRSQFLSYFSFPLIDTSDGMGFPAKGGLRLQNTDCDWLYQDFKCEETGNCVLASPGYPGVYPPHRRCKYHITCKSENIQIRVTFTTILLPQNSCKTDYISVFKGRSINSPLLETFCGDQRKVIEYSGPNLLIEFSSGPQNPPYDYNGFVAHVEFLERKTTTLPPVIWTTNVIDHMETTPKLDLSYTANNFSGCEITLSGSNVRSGHFDTREHDLCQISRLTFIGKVTDVVHVSIFNYRLRSPMCKTVIEIFDGPMDVKKNLIGKMCSPQDKHNNNFDFDTKKILSSGNELVIYFQRPTIPQATNEAEFIAGQYFFHDEQIRGTIKPTGLCNVVYRGNTSPSVGTIQNPITESLYVDTDSPISCTQEFVPVTNQSITISIKIVEHMSKDIECITQCGDNGCFCTSQTSLQEIDHLLLLNAEGKRVACLCGEIQREILPVVVQSWGPITLLYSIVQYTWKKKGFDFSASYNFNVDHICGEEVYTVHTGEINSKNLTAAENLNHFYVQGCTWTLHSNVERQLELEIYSHQNRPCTAWNISIHEYSASSANHLGDVHQRYCSRDAHKVYLLPWKLNTVIIRLNTLSRTLPQFRIKWKSQVVRVNTRYGSPTPAPNAISCSGHLAYSYLVKVVLLFMYTIFTYSMLVR